MVNCAQYSGRRAVGTHAKYGMRDTMLFRIVLLSCLSCHSFGVVAIPADGAGTDPGSRTCRSATGKQDMP